MFFNNPFLNKKNNDEKNIQSIKEVEKYFPNCYRYGMRYILSTLEKESNCSFQRLEFCDCTLSFLTILMIMSQTEKNTLFKALKQFNNYIKPEDCDFKGNYLKFKNGLIYDCDFNYYKFFSSIKSNVLKFEDCALDLESSNLIRFGNLRSNIARFLNQIIKHKDNDNDEMTSYEYAELCFVKGLSKQIKADNLLETEIDNILNSLLEQ